MNAGGDSHAGNEGGVQSYFDADMVVGGGD